MKKTLLGLILFGLASITLGRTPRPQEESQGAKQDMKDAADATKHAAKKTGKGVEKAGSEAEKTTKKGVHKSAHEVKKGAAKVEGKTEPQ